MALLWVLDGNERAQGFYSDDGWAPTGARKDDVVWGVPVVEVEYRTTIAQLR